MKKNSLYEKSNISFEPSQKSYYLKNQAKSINYSMNLLGVQTQGVLYAFHIKNATIAIMKQNSNIYSKDNEYAFKMIEESLRIEGY